LITGKSFSNTKDTKCSDPIKLDTREALC